MHRASRTSRATAFRAVLIALVAAAALVGGLVASTGTAGAAASGKPRAAGVIATVFQHRDRSVTVSGYAWDRANPNRSAYVCVGVGRSCLRVTKATIASPRFNRAHHVTGRHAFRVRIRPVRVGAIITLRTVHANHAYLDRMKTLTAGQRVLRIAKRFVGRVPYVYGGSSPRSGFDCSGYAMYAYRNARVASLPHNSQAQRFSRHMYRIPRSHALPGDLVFYLSGSYSYHTAIYAGHGMQVSATDPRDGIKYQRIWDRNVIFGTDWH